MRIWKFELVLTPFIWLPFYRFVRYIPNRGGFSDVFEWALILGPFEFRKWQYM